MLYLLQSHENVIVCNKYHLLHIWIQSLSQKHLLGAWRILNSKPKGPGRVVSVETDSLLASYIWKASDMFVGPFFLVVVIF